MGATPYLPWWKAAGPDHGLDLLLRSPLDIGVCCHGHEEAVELVRGRATTRFDDIASYVRGQLVGEALGVLRLSQGRNEARHRSAVMNLFFAFEPAIEEETGATGVKIHGLPADG